MSTGIADVEALPHNLVLFVRLLRRAGIAVGSGQLIDLGRALRWIGIENRTRLKAAARSLLIHRREDLAIFERLFDAFFSTPRKRARSGSPPSVRRKRPDELGRRTLFHLMSVGAGNESLERELKDRAGSFSPEEALRTKSFAKLDPEELEELERLIAMLRLEPAQRTTRRFEVGPRGERLALRRVIRDAARHAGQPVRLSYRRRKTKPRPLIVVADISGSMERYSRVVLQLLYTLVRNHREVETFVFGTRLTRITEQLRTRNIDRAISEAADRIIDWSGGTRIGSSLAAFRRHWGKRVLRRGAVVIIISDGCERGDVEQLREEMAQLRRRCERLIWLNPLAGADDYLPLVEGVAAVLPFVDDFLPIRNFESLELLGRTLSRLGRARRPQRLAAASSGKELT